MDDATRSIYEANAVQWTERRQPRQLDKAREISARSSGPSIDLGCGPGWYAAVLPTPVIAFDGARSMLELVASAAPSARRVQGDLELLPFRRGSFHAAWARNSYVHLPRTSVPLALADLHRALALDASLSLALFGGASEGRELFENDDFPGRFFSLWDPDTIVEIVTSAGFIVDDFELHERANGEQSIQIEATRARTLPDFVGPGLRVLVCGLNPSLNAADAGVGFARPGNRFWPAAIAAGLVSVDRDPWHALRHHHVGFTDLVKRATVGAKELSTDEYRAGFARLERLAGWLEPGIIAFVGLAGWRAAVDRKAAAGPQERTVGGRPVYVMPSSSGLNAHSSVDSLAQHLRAALAMT
jgi:TDG/mug DNA glycosylase family protein